MDGSVWVPAIFTTSREIFIINNTMKHRLQLEVLVLRSSQLLSSRSAMAWNKRSNACDWERALFYACIC
jgi:hypothetical protein